MRSKNTEILERIPVYPQSIYIPNKINCNFAVDIPLCEGKEGNISFVSQEAKDNYINKYRRKDHKCL